MSIIYMRPEIQREKGKKIAQRILEAMDVGDQIPNDEIGNGLFECDKCEQLHLAFSMKNTSMHDHHIIRHARSLLKRHINAVTMYFFTSRELLYVMLQAVGR